MFFAGDPLHLGWFWSSGILDSDECSLLFEHRATETVLPVDLTGFEIEALFQNRSML